MQPPAPQAGPPAARAPSTTGDPGNAGVQATYGQNAQAQQIEELKSIVLGMGRTQNMLMLLVLELAQNQLGFDKASLAALAVKNSLAGEPENLFEAAVNQGKAG